MKLLTAVKANNAGEEVLALVFIKPNPGAITLYDSTGYRIIIWDARDMVCTCGNVLEKYASLDSFAAAIQNLADERAFEQEGQGVGIFNDELQVVDYDDGSLLLSMKFSNLEYRSNIDMKKAQQTEGQE